MWVCLFFSCSRLTGCRAVALKFGRCGLHLVQAYERGELEIKPKSRKARKSVVPSRKQYDSDDEVDIRRPPSSLTSVEQELLKRCSRSPKKKKEKSKPTTFEDITADKACITRKCRNAAAPSKSGLCIACYNLLLEVNTRDPNADDFSQTHVRPKHVILTNSNPFPRGLNELVNTRHLGSTGNQDTPQPDVHLIET